MLGYPLRERLCASAAVVRKALHPITTKAASLSLLPMFMVVSILMSI
jgi:hypothetical protein